MDAVAKALGHAGTAVTRGHYLQPGTEQSARGRGVADLLLGEQPTVQSTPQHEPDRTVWWPTELN